MVFFGSNISRSISSFLSSGANAILGVDTMHGPGNANAARPNPLYDAVQGENWDAALQILERARAGNSRQSSKPRRAGNDGLLPLHMLCWVGAGRRQDNTNKSSRSISSSETDDESTSSREAESQFLKCQKVLDLLLEAYPNAAKRKDNSWGWTPLHMACYSARSSVVTVRKLLAVHPAACSVRDEQHLVPLHRACLMASDDVSEIVRALLLADPSQVNVEIRNGERDVPFHLLVARIHHEIQKERFQPLRMQKDYGLAKSSQRNSNASASSSSSSSSSDDDEPGEEVANRNTWPFHEPHPILENLIEATFLVLEAEERGSIGNGYLTKQRMVELVNGCLRNCRCPNQRLFAYMALWDHPELATMSMKNTDTCGVIGESDGSEITTSSSVSRSTSGIMLHVAAGHAKHSINDCHWCAACNRGLADPHFVSQDSGESCDLTCAYKKCSIDNTEETGNSATEDNNNNTGRARRRSSWYQRYKDRMYKDVVLTIPYGCILKQIANLYPQAAETRTDDGTLPLHLAIRNGHTWIPGIQAIYRSYPAAGSVRDASTGLYPYQLAAAKKPQPEDDGEWDRKRYLSELTTSFELLRADPDVILKN